MAEVLMNFNVYIDKRTGEKLEHLAKRRGASRNRLVREALAHLLDREKVTGWPEAVLGFTGVEKFEPFEKRRCSLLNQNIYLPLSA
jgi:Ribbon-helix-helix protein, copG family